jgi:hypothetical protein
MLENLKRRDKLWDVGVENTILSIPIIFGEE